MVNVKKNVLTQKQAEKENVGTYHHPTNKTWRSGACVIGEELRKGYYRNGYTTESGKKVEPTYVNASCSKAPKNGRLIKDNKILNNNKIRKEILTEKQALKKPIGSYYHPNENTWRSGACPKGQILKKGYKRKSYVTKTGKVIPETYIDPVCVKDKGKSGKNINNEPFKNKSINNKSINNKNVNNKLVNNNKKNNKPINNKLVNNNKKNNKPINNKSINNKPVNNKPVNNKPINNKPVNNKPVNNKPVNNKLVNNKIKNKLYHNIAQSNVQELTNNMIINLMKNNKL